MWTVTSASADSAVLFASSTRLEEFRDPESSEVTGAAWVEDSQTAYRLVRSPEGWRVADRHVFEEHRHPADLAAMATMAQTYRRLLTDALGAFSTGDFDNLDVVLDGAALEDYRQRVQTAADAGKLARISLDGTFAVIDLSADTATAVFVGTVSIANIDPTTGTFGVPSQQPYSVMHRLERRDGDWRIVFELPDATRVDADGTRHLPGCG
jgi:hypothetical protein